MNPERWKRIEDLYHAALEQDASIRGTFLDKECRDDDLRQEVESLLRADDGESFLEEPLALAAAPMLSSPRKHSRLASGIRLGPYEVLSPIASGGMGEVYSARDIRLDRIVAIKTLPSHLAGRRDLRDRFEREARTISNLNHPHICTLYDIGHQDGIDFMVMEYLDGETLARRLSKGRLPFSEALRAALQIADALDKAHRHGVVHRDLKPSNIILTKAGAKLLDFGVAKQVQAAPNSGAAGAPASITSTTSPMPDEETLTLNGTVLGTVQYMAPEQLEGRDADPRTDIFAFGAIVYEMLTGQKTFESRGDVNLVSALQVSALADDSIPISPVQSGAPALLDHLLEHLVKTCLLKDPDHRWQTMADVVIQLKLIADSGAELVSLAAAGKTKRRLRLAWSAAAVLIAAAIAFLAGSMFPKEKAESAKISVEIPTPSAPSTLDIALSPNGSRVAAIVSTEQGEDVLWLRALEHLSAQIVLGTQGAGLPFWSPDGRFIGFFADGKLKRVDLTGAPPRTISDAAAGRGGTWNTNDVIVFAAAGTGPLFRVSAGGGVPARATELDNTREERAHRHPQFLPDGQHFLYLALSRKPEYSGIYAGSLNSSERKFLVNTTLKAVFAPPDHMLYVRGGTLVSQRFDLKRLELSGEAVPVAQDVGTNVVTNSADFTVSSNGTLGYRTGGSGGNTYLIQFDRSGKEIGRVGAPASYESPVLSPDLHRLAVGRPEGSASNIWILDLVRGPLTRFTFGLRSDTAPLWSQDGSRIVYASNRGGAALDLYEQSSSGVGQEQVLFKSDHSKVPEHWSPDGRFLLFRDDDPQSQADLWVLPMDGQKSPAPVVRSPFRDIQGRFSPDGKWIAYVSNESARNEVYVQGFPAAGRKLQISPSGGFQPRWGRDGKEILFISGAPSHTSVVMAVDIAVSSDGALNAAVPHKLFAVNPVSAVAHRNTWDVTPDGQQFLINSSQQKPSSSIPITLVVNWRGGGNGQ